MKRTAIFSFVLLILGLQNASGLNFLTYYQTINKAEIAHLDKDYGKADSLYQFAFNLVDKPFKNDYLLAAVNSDLLAENGRTYEYLVEGISVGLTIKSIRKHLSTFKKSKEWKILREKYDSLHQEYVGGLNTVLRTELLSMVDSDQAARHPIFGSLRKMESTDSLNYERLSEIIIANNGKWPGRSLIGDGKEGDKYAYGEITIMLHHFTSEQVNNLKPILVDAILRGDLSPYNAAYPLDYKNLVRIGNINKSSYDICFLIGSYIGHAGKKPVICDCEKAEGEREKLGLEPLNDYFRKRSTTFECYYEE
ncbi:hypothetical protein ABWH96_20645 [Marivirga tractuosa]|uniref:hypothetical protein n=1 Tax=Marivirga tractuosa TaxID=1006 RepID=UPI0035D0625C